MNSQVGSTKDRTAQTTFEIFVFGFWLTLLTDPSCSTFDIISENFPWSTKTIVILCFDGIGNKYCWSFDGDVPGKLTEISDSNFGHWTGGLTRYNKNLITVGGMGWSGTHQETELMERNQNGTFTWSVLKSDFIFTPSKKISYHSLITIPTSYENEEYALLIGGIDGDWGQSKSLESVFKYNGTWFPFGQLKNPRQFHNSIYWNRSVFVIGGTWRNEIMAQSLEKRLDKTKIEVWDMNHSPDQFATNEKWPELFGWRKPHLFIVPDAFFPDYPKPTV